MTMDQVSGDTALKAVDDAPPSIVVHKLTDKDDSSESESYESDSPSSAVSENIEPKEHKSVFSAQSTPSRQKSRKLYIPTPRAKLKSVHKSPTEVVDDLFQRVLSQKVLPQ